MTDDYKPQKLEDLCNGGDVPLEAFQERAPQDVADKVRFLYLEFKSRLALRDRAVESLLQTECEIGSRLGEVVRAYGWFNEVGEKERAQLNQELRNVERQRREIYDSAARELLTIKTDLMDALLEYRALRRRKLAFAGLLDIQPALAGPSTLNGYAFPPLPQYLVSESGAREDHHNDETNHP